MTWWSERQKKTKRMSPKQVFSYPRIFERRRRQKSAQNRKQRKGLNRKRFLTEEEPIAVDSYNDFANDTPVDLPAGVKRIEIPKRPPS